MSERKIFFEVDATVQKGRPIATPRPTLEQAIRAAFHLPVGEFSEIVVRCHDEADVAVAVDQLQELL